MFPSLSVEITLFVKPCMQLSFTMPAKAGLDMGIVNAGCLQSMTKLKRNSRVRGEAVVLNSQKMQEKTS